MSSYYPLCLDVAGRRCVVVGGGTVAERKALTLVDAGAKVAVVSANLSAGLRRLSEEGRIEHLARSYEPGDLGDAFLAVAATDDPRVNQAVSGEARERRVLVNVVDDAAQSDFTLPSVLRRGDLVVAVSTNGRSPALARYVRTRLEDVVTADHAALLEIVAAARDRLRSESLLVPPDAWQTAIDDELLDLLHRGQAGEASTLLEGRLHDLARARPQASELPGAVGSDSAPPPHATPASGFVSLVGAGPGDPDLITVKGLRRLREADVVVYDRLVDERLLSEVRPDAELIYVGKVAAHHTLRQTEINALLVASAREGKRVVRLKGGDPFVFGRGAEEAQDLADAGIPFEIVPGITSAVGAPAYAGIPLTHRHYASSFAVITGHEDPTKPVTRIAWEKLATAVDTIVCLMSMENLPHIVEQLVRHGRPPQTPVCIIRWGTWRKQETITATLADISALVSARGFGPPAVAVIGEVVRLRERIRWFEALTLPTS